jgi:hypothetical protein
LTTAPASMPVAPESVIQAADVYWPGGRAACWIPALRSGGRRGSRVRVGVAVATGTAPDTASAEPGHGGRLCPCCLSRGGDLGGDTAVRTDRRTVLRHGDENRRLGGGLASPFGGT